MRVSKLFQRIPTLGSIGQWLPYVWSVERVERVESGRRQGKMQGRSVKGSEVRAKVNVETRQVDWIGLTVVAVSELHGRIR